jgi:hypothetical protein
MGIKGNNKKKKLKTRISKNCNAHMNRPHAL